MSYVRWSYRSHELLNQWAVKITTNLVARNRYADVMALMACMNHIDFLMQMAMSSHEINRDANEWLSMKLHVLGDDLNYQNWSDSLNNPKILSVLCEISEFITVNQLDGNSVESLDFPQRLKIPTSKPVCFSLDF